MVRVRITAERATRLSVLKSEPETYAPSAPSTRNAYQDLVVLDCRRQKRRKSSDTSREMKRKSVYARTFSGRQGQLQTVSPSQSYPNGILSPSALKKRPDSSQASKASRWNCAF